MTYAAVHARAGQQVTRKGASVSFTESGTTVAGTAVRVAGDPIRYQQLELVESEAPTLLFWPSTLGQLPALHALVTWGGTKYKVLDVDPVAPDGTAIVARVVIGR